MVERVLVASVHGTCAGVDRALNIAERALQKYGRVYGVHEPVHNKLVTSDLVSRGFVLVEDVGQIPHGGVVVFSAHGTDKATAKLAHERGLVVIEAACPLVSKVHREFVAYHREGRKIIVVGNREHQEIKGLLGQVDDHQHVCVVGSACEVSSLSFDEGDPVAYVTQTTLNADTVAEIVQVIEGKFSDVVGPGVGDVCFATKNRQDAVRQLSKLCDAVLVIGSQHSSNSKHLLGVAQECGAAASAYLIDDFSQVGALVGAYPVVGVTAGASVTKEIFNKVLSDLSEAFPGVMTEYLQGVVERVNFPVPEFV